jgi:hypothetical protein
MRSSLLVPTIVGALVIGCADSQAPTPAATTPALSVEHTTEEFGFGFSDGHWFVFVGVSVEDLTGFLCTGTGGTVDLVDGLHVFRPDGSRKDRLKGEERLAVFERPAFDESFCDDPLAVPTFTGSGRLSLNDNDFFVTGNRTDASMVHVTGTVTDESGQPYHLVAFGHQLLEKGHPAPDVVLKQLKYHIKLTPIGR